MKPHRVTFPVAATGAVALTVLAITAFAPSASADPGPVPGSPGYAAATTAAAHVVTTGLFSSTADVVAGKVEADVTNSPQTSTVTSLTYGSPAVTLVKAETADSTATSTDLGSGASSSLTDVVIGVGSYASLVRISAIDAEVSCPVQGTPTAQVQAPASVVLLGQTVPITAGSASVTGSLFPGVNASAGVSFVTHSTTASAAAASGLTASVSVTSALLSITATLTLADVSCVTPDTPAPVALSLAPASGPDTGGTSVIVTGNYFFPGSTVTIGGITIPADDVTVDSLTSLSFVTPAHAAGPVDVTVTTPGGTTSPALSFTYLPSAPTITSPANDATISTPTPTISGTGIAGDTVTVTEGATTICTAVVAEDTTWNCVASAPLTAGSHTISAVQKTPGGLVSEPSASVTFTVTLLAAASTANLAATGTHDLVAVQAGLAVLLLGAGLCLLANHRRRRA